MEEIIQFQKERITALEKEVERLKGALKIKENSLHAYLKRLNEVTKDPAFNKPILTKNYSNESNATMA
jgi:hypothetical protein